MINVDLVVGAGTNIFSTENALRLTVVGSFVLFYSFPFCLRLEVLSGSRPTCIPFLWPQCALEEIREARSRSRAALYDCNTRHNVDWNANRCSNTRQVQSSSTNLPTDAAQELERPLHYRHRITNRLT